MTYVKLETDLSIYLHISEVYILGLVGMVLIILGWLASFRTIPDVKLSLLYASGSILLSLYALSLGDLVFTILNIAATIIAVVNIFRWVRKR